MDILNWAGNIRYSAKQILSPTTVEEVQEVVRQNPKIRVLGSRHSFNRIADSTDTMLSMEARKSVVSLDKVNHRVTVEGGIRYGELAPLLQENGYALPNLASLPHISVAGACATATHGSGVQNGNLATVVSALEFVNAAGEVVVLERERDGEQFNGAVVNLGAIGVVTKLTLDLQPTFQVSQVVYQQLPMKALEHEFQAMMSAGYSVSLFTTWQNQRINQAWIKRLETEQTAESPAMLYGAATATQDLHPLEELSAEHATPQLGQPGAWHDRLPHFKMGFQPSAGAELQSEFFVPLENGYAAMMTLEKLHDKLAPYLFVSEIRTIAADNLWMSPCYQRACVAFHFTWKQEWEAVRQLLPLIEEALAPYKPVPHWGKLFTLAPAVLQARLPKLEDFKGLLHHHDPQGKFRNDFLTRNLYSA